MKIIALQAENIKRLVAVEIRPDGALVQITGRNGAGKSSVLDAIWWALAGASNIQAVPIRKGAEQGKIRLDLGGMVVTRTFQRREDETYTTGITVETETGARFPSPQKVLDALLGSLSFDPLGFTRMKPAEQAAELRKFVPDFDFADADARNRADFAARTDINRDAKAARSRALGIVLPADVPADPIDEAAIIDRLQSAADHNVAIDRRRERREAVAREVDQHEADARAHREEAAALRAQADAEDALALRAEEAAKVNRELLATADPLPEPVDVADLRQRLAAAQETNALVAQRKARDAHTAEAEALEARSAALTKAMADREAQKRAAIAKADLPVPGLGFGEDAITIDGLPFDQASDAQQLRTSVAIAMASNPKLRVIRVRDGSLLDEDGMKILAEMAEAADYQVWIERVDSSGVVGFALEDGHLKGAE